MDEMKTTVSNPETGEKTFTQEQVNAIIGERLAKEKTKADAALAEREQQIAQRELMLEAKEKMNEMGIPVELLDALNVSSKEAMEKSLTTIKTVLDKQKAVRPQFVGFQPGVATAKPSEISMSAGDLEVRQAMRLP